ncbi:MAG: hypothetical protein NTW21_26700 [Verrucomicrobia bacterium]|nr:hypothetical protein [Verrucomicrobiota bacterium]
MRLLRLTTDCLVRRLRWVMVGVILSDTINTLLGQPKSYWQHPATAYEHNQFIRLFVTQGYLPFVLWSLLYIAGAFIAVSILPRRFALMTLFSFILGHYFGASSWWVYHWGYGMQGAIIYGIILAVVLVLCGVGGHAAKLLRTSNPNDRSA